MKNIIIIFFCTLSFSIMAQKKKNWPGVSNYLDGTLGYELLRIFKPHCEACKIDQIGKKFKKIPENKRNYIPENLTSQVSIKNFSLKETNYKYISSASRGLVFNAFNKTEIDDENLNIDQSIGDYRKMSVSSNSMPKNFLAAQDDRPNFLLRANCAAYIESAAKAKIGIPVAKFEAAMDANANSQSSVILIYGWISSPLFQYLSNSETQLMAYQDAWLFYNEKPKYIDDAYFIQEFLGLQVKHLLGQEQNIDFDAKLNAKGGIGIFSGSISAAAGLSKSNIYTQRNWETYLIQNIGNTNVRWEKMANTSEIKDLIEAGISKKIESYSKYSVVTKGEFTHFAILEGLEKSLCGNASNWELNLISKGVYSKDEASVTFATFNENDKTCVCTVNGYLEESQFTANSLTSPLSVEYELINKKKITKTSGEEYFLKFAFSDRFTKSDHPTARTEYNDIINGTKPSSLGQEYVNVVWEVPIYFNDKNKPVDFNLGTEATLSNGDNPSYSGLSSNEQISMTGFRADRDDSGDEIYLLEFKLNRPLLKSSISGSKEIATRVNFFVPLEDSSENANLTLGFNLVMPDKKPDTDGDGLFDDDDNCPNVINGEQKDSDNDTVGDKCDNCIKVSNLDQTDSDQDGIGDACEPSIVEYVEPAEKSDTKKKKSKN